MTTGVENSDVLTLRAQIQDSLLRLHGPLLGGEALAIALGHRSGAALRQARRRGLISVPLFTVPNRRGWFALTVEYRLLHRFCGRSHTCEPNRHLDFLPPETRAKLRACTFMIHLSHTERSPGYWASLRTRRGPCAYCY
ncbi:MAG TPA: hypothetical protein VJU59_39365 [Paraburkholderia sp.]|uniref:hypothetical protein n=1 Tax=Paraburkholderia sp. TaxID=1926495 RepID=UPI002B46BAC9|nr:hypothetical protein [Paraburkholderia sp.]HKR45659.1 hypothetical protein [Paraburkholderia sp.]